ncbi:hypothetical protein CONLIGDRAFT_636087, partial [Coniochaeta ligniaria NRRL 30616]
MYIKLHRTTDCTVDLAHHLDIPSYRTSPPHEIFIIVDHSRLPQRLTAFTRTMHIIQSTQKDQTASVQDRDRTDVLTDIQKLAERVVSYREDMDPMPGRSNLLLHRAVSEPAQALDDLLHDSIAMVRLPLTIGDSKLTRSKAKGDVRMGCRERIYHRARGENGASNILAPGRPPVVQGRPSFYFHLPTTAGTQRHHARWRRGSRAGGRTAGGRTTGGRNH